MAVITYRDCRALHHAYERMARPGDEVSPPPETGLWEDARWVINLRCLRCGTWRYLAIDHRGGILAVCYRYPDDYLRPAGEPRVPAEDMRLWLAKPNGKR
jgi:hypothetical protein